MDDLEVAKFWRKGSPGTLSVWCRGLIGGTAVASIVVAYLSWHVIWHLYGCDAHFYVFWVRNGVWLGLAAASVAAIASASPVSRFIRLAVLLPLFQLVALIGSGVLWMALQEHADEYGHAGYEIIMPFHPSAAVAGAVVVLVGGAWLIQRREWLQSMLVLALSFLLLLGTWLPYCAASWFNATNRYLGDTLLTPGPFLANAVIPPLVASIAFTTAVMRWPAVARKKRAWVIAAVALLLLVAATSQIEPRHEGNALYLNVVHLVLMAQGLAIVSVAIVATSMWLAARRARTRLRGACSEHGTIVDPDGEREPVVELQLVGWLRAPRILTYPFEVITTRDRTAVGGAAVLWSVPAASTRLATGERWVVLRRGDTITRYSQDLDSAGHPFRSTRHVEVLAIAAPDAGNGFTNMALMLWRPATAYMAISLAIMVPAALALLAGS